MAVFSAPPNGQLASAGARLLERRDFTSIVTQGPVFAQRVASQDNENEHH